MATDDQEHPEEISIDGRRWLDEHNNPENWIEEEFESPTSMLNVRDRRKNKAGLRS